MHIGLIAPPWVAVPPPAYGGTEAVVGRLARGLQAIGHVVTLFTVGESTCPVPRRWRYPRAVVPLENSALEAAHVLSAYGALAGVDLIHDHTLLGPLIGRSVRPVVTTIHSPFTADTREIYRASAGRVALVCISDDQRRSAPEVPVARVIHHGIDVEDFPPGDGSGGYVLFLGRMSPDKGVHRAISVARAAGLPLLIGAKMREPTEREYFEEKVRPLLGDGVEYLGEVGTARRLELLQGARALLNPIQWPEPFGLVMIEALACGTPVIAQSIGSAPEIVTHGRTGFLCHDEDAMATALHDVGALDRAACRADAVAKFSTERMVRDHVDLYRAVVGGRTHPRPPAGRLGLARAS